MSVPVAPLTSCHHRDVEAAGYGTSANQNLHEMRWSGRSFGSKTSTIHGPLRLRDQNIDHSRKMRVAAMQMAGHSGPAPQDHCRQRSRALSVEYQRSEG